MRLNKHLPWLSLFLLIAAIGGAAARQGEDAKQPKASSYAPAKDLLAQVEYFLGRIEIDLADAEDYGEEQQERVSNDAYTLSALAAVLAHHDEQHALKMSATALGEAARELGESAEDYAAAKKAFALATKAAAAEATSKSEASWEDVADLSALMKQVPIVDSSLRRGVTGRRFKRSANRSAGYAATVAAIAQVSQFDTTYCSDEADTARWQKLCQEMRDAAAATHHAVRAGDQKKATTAIDRLAKTCDACHHEFRD